MQPTGATSTPPTDQARPSSWPPEQAVLGHLLDAHPRRLDALALAGELRDRLEPTDVERAILNLSEAGLIERRGEAVAPAPKVIEFEARVG
jgi:hypothetical protein